jgi:hypothetical protein
MTLAKWIPILSSLKQKQRVDSLQARASAWHIWVNHIPSKKSFGFLISDYSNGTQDPEIRKQTE